MISYTNNHSTIDVESHDVTAVVGKHAQKEIYKVELPTVTCTSYAHAKTINNYMIQEVYKKVKDILDLDN